MEIGFFLQELRQLSNAERALKDQRYHKSSREHWGVSIPACTQLTRHLSQGFDNAKLLRLAQALWETNLFDPMMCAAKVLSSSRLQPSSDL